MIRSDKSAREHSPALCFYAAFLSGGLPYWQDASAICPWPPTAAFRSRPFRERFAAAVFRYNCTEKRQATEPTGEGGKEKP